MSLGGRLEVAKPLEAARRFIRQKRNSDGLWSDFLTLAGESVFWVSGYVGSAMVGWGASEKEEGWLRDVGSRIVGEQGVAGGWGYGPGVPGDADSTAWCLIFLSRLGENPDNRERARRFLLLHQSRLDGGFRTYAKPVEVGRYMVLGEGVSFEGWSSSQTCVTGVAVKAILEAGSDEGIEEALEFIRGSQTPEGFWPSYWWTEGLYATVQCMEALDITRRGDYSRLLTMAQEWISRTQHVDGGWSDLSASEAFPFSTALAVKGLMIGEGPKRYPREVRRGMEWLLSRQLDDGSWAPQHMLRIPHPSVKDPWRQTSWKQDGRAIGAVIRDHRRLYTTATAIGAILEYDKRSR